MISDERLKQLAAQETMREQADMAKELLALRKERDIPVGWKITPQEPSLEMMKAGYQAVPSAYSYGAYGEIYVAMLEAAPEPE